jgi:predicted small integral membrane protein
MAAGWLSVRFSPTVAKGGVRLIFLGLLAAFYLRSGWLPVVALRGAGIALVASVVIFLALRRTLGSRNA